MIITRIHVFRYIVMIYALCQKNYAAYRPIFLFWAGDIINSLLVLLPGVSVLSRQRTN